MRIHEVVALQARESTLNVPGEFVIAAVDSGEKLHQLGGIDLATAHALVDLMNAWKTRGSALRGNSADEGGLAEIAPTAEASPKGAMRGKATTSTKHRKEA